MKLAIMQPYFFPYLGYFQLLFATDKFVFYDDVNYIKGGWINRNRILLDGQPKYITIPLSGMSPFKRINQIPIFEQGRTWRSKMLDTLRMAYHRAPNRDIGASLVEDVLGRKSSTIADLARASVEAVLEYLGVARDIVPSSEIYANQDLRAQERVLSICRKESATVYINLVGGMNLYQADAFMRQGCELQLLRARLPEYSQGGDPFVPGLSIVDVIMHCGRNQISDMLSQFEILSPQDAQA